MTSGRFLKHGLFISLVMHKVKRLFVLHLNSFPRIEGAVKLLYLFSRPPRQVQLLRQHQLQRLHQVHRLQVLIALPLMLIVTIKRLILARVIVVITMMLLRRVECV